MKQCDFITKKKKKKKDLAKRLNFSKFKGKFSIAVVFIVSLENAKLENKTFETFYHGMSTFFNYTVYSKYSDSIL